MDYEKKYLKYKKKYLALKRQLEGAGLFGRLVRKASSVASAASSAASSVASAVLTTGSWADVNFDSDLSASVSAGNIKKFQFTSATTTFPNMDTDGVRGFTFTSGSIFTAARILPQFTKYDFANNTLNFWMTGSTAETNGTAVAGNSTVFYFKNTTDQFRGDFEASGSYSIPNAASATQIIIPEINVRMQSQAITAKTKKLKAVWTPEFAQDLAAYQNIDAEAELTNIMSEYISMEIDLEILDMLIEDAAAGTEFWSAVNNTVITAGAAAPTTLASGFYNTQGQWFQTLGTKIQKLSNKIHQLTLRGGANFLVTSPTVATILESIPGFASTNNGDAHQEEYAFGVQKIGTVNGRYKVYKNPYMTENLILLGYKGSQFLESGAVFAPYIPMIMTPLVYDPETFVPRKGLLTRYAKKMLRPEFYAKIYINGLNTI
jgi:hypothetical protein